MTVARLVSIRFEKNGSTAETPVSPRSRLKNSQSCLFRDGRRANPCTWMSQALRLSLHCWVSDVHLTTHEVAGPCERFRSKGQRRSFVTALVGTIHIFRCMILLLCMFHI